LKRIVVTGATGVIGQGLVGKLRERGDAVIALSRDQARGRQVLGSDIEVVAWPDPLGSGPPAEALAGADAVVHLLGEPVAQRWSSEAKVRIRDSRVLSTRQLVSALRGLGDDDRPSVLVSQSATGYYGPRDDHELDEEAPPGNDFLAQVVSAWETEAQAAEPHMRVVRTRTGVVLSPQGGALARMLPFFRLGIGGPVAGGRQYIPWIHLDDVVAAMLFCVDAADARGALNLTSPHPVTNAEFSRALGRALKRPAILPVPGLALRVLYGEMAQIVTTGQRVIPRRLEELGFDFGRAELEPALRDVVAAG
jgi:uncharacterized protein (TIGR01777 family)